LKEYFLFAAKYMASQILWVITFQGDRLFIARLLPLTELGYYSIASSLSQKFNTLGGAIWGPIFPMYAELHGTEQEERLRRFYLRSSQLFLYVILPLSTMLFLLAPQFFTLWLGSEFSVHATWPVRLLVIGNVAYLAAMLPVVLASGRGHPQLGVYLQAAKAALLFALWVLLIPRLGLVGAALAFLISQWVALPFLLRHVHNRLLGIDARTFWSEACLPPVIATAALAALGLPTHGAIHTWTGLIAYGVVLGGLFCGVGYRLLDRDAKDILRAWIRSKTGEA